MNDVFHLCLKMEYTPPDETTDCWTLMFPELNVGSQGATPEEATTNALEALTLWIETWMNYGSIEKVLLSHGLTQTRVHAIEENLRSWYLPISSHGKSTQCRA